MLTRPIPPGADYLLAACAAGLSATVSLGALYRALAVGQMTVVMPIAATASIIPFLVGIAHGEHPSMPQVAGVALALLGMVACARGPTTALPGERSALARGAGLALLAAVGGGCYLVAMDAASRGGVVWALWGYRLTNAAVVTVTCLPMMLRNGDTPFRRDVGLVAIGLLEFTAALAYSLAVTLGFLSLVSVLASLYPVTTVVLARVLLAERLSAAQRRGLIQVLVGLAMVVGA